MSSRVFEWTDFYPDHNEAKRTSSRMAPANELISTLDDLADFCKMAKKR